MPRYTQARLVYALQVFRESLPYRTKHGSKTENLEQHLKKYELRTSKSRNVAQRASLWIDKDDSGDYEPSKSSKRELEPRRPKPRNNKRKEREFGDDRENGAAFKKRSRTWKSGRNNGEICKVVLKLTSETGRKKLQQLAGARVPPLVVQNLCDMEDSQQSLWSLAGENFSQTPRHSVSSAARRRSMFGSDVGSDGDKEGPQSCGLGLRARTVVKAPRVHQSSERCVACRQAKRRCSQRKSDVGLPCTQCRKDGINCSLASPEIEKETKVSPDAHCDTPITIESPSSACLDIKWIATSFVHPINFKFSAAQNPARTCDFCRDYRYGIVGCGCRKNVEVLVEGGKIVEEMGGGYRAEGQEPTNMCIMCALDRFQISRCSKHEILPIAGLSPGDFDYRQALANFSTPGVPATNYWCSFCISPAFFACGAAQQYKKLGEPLTGAQMQNGCGLFLCPACAVAFGQFGMDRVKLEEQVRRRGNWKVRADMEFLFHGSELHKAYCPS